MIVDGNIKLTRSGNYSELHCPRCGSANLHHLGVSMFDRAEDASSLVKTVMSGSAATMQVVSSDGSGNPSERRHGLTIQFECEQCGGNSPDHTIELTIAQHKGATQMAWRFSPRS